VIPGHQASRSSSSRNDPSGQGAAQGEEGGERQQRALHLWSDGFSIDDGPLHRFDDPQNRADLDMIRSGRAPLHLMNVQLDQPVDVKLQQHNEAWHQLPKVYRPFGGEGRRLGSPVPGDGAASAAAPQAPSSNTASAPAASSASSSAPTTNIDDTQPMLTLRVQLPDGTRLPARFNTSMTVGDVYDFVGRASPATQTRPWVLATTFPNKDHTDKSLVLGDVAEFKRGGTAVVKWA
jgi:UBX domain-containing protein 1